MTTYIPCTLKGTKCAASNAQLDCDCELLKTNCVNNDLADGEGALFSTMEMTVLGIVLVIVFGACIGFAWYIHCVHPHAHAHEHAHDDHSH